MIIEENLYNKMPDNLKAMFDRLPNLPKDEVMAVFPQKARSSGHINRSDSNGGKPGFVQGKGFAVPGENTYNDSGSAARFFYCAKSSKRERNAGMPEGEANIHPTCKPLSLLDYLCKLSRTPTGGVVLDPFMGSGTTGVACVRTGRDFIGIEKELDYFNISSKRIEAERIENEKKQPKLFSIADERHNVA